MRKPAGAVRLTAREEEKLREWQVARYFKQ